MSMFFNWFDSSEENDQVPIKKRKTKENIEQELDLIRQVKAASDRLYNYLLEEAVEKKEEEPPKETPPRRRRRTEVEILEAQYASWKK